jgi:hypothetical protein
MKSKKFRNIVIVAVVLGLLLSVAVSRMSVTDGEKDELLLRWMYEDCRPHVVAYLVPAGTGSWRPAGWLSEVKQLRHRVLESFSEFTINRLTHQVTLTGDIETSFHSRFWCEELSDRYYNFDPPIAE